MMEQCFDEGTIQSFLDGELENEMLETVARHVSVCDSCALLLTEAEDESAFAFSVLDEEFNSLVPTERIRTHVFQAIEEFEKPNVSIREKLWSFASILFNPRYAAFATLAIVIAGFAFIFNFNQREDRYQIASESIVNVFELGGINLPKQPVIEIDEPILAKRRGGVQPANYASQPQAKSSRTRTQIVRQREIFNRGAAEENIDGEASYLKTIATLEDSVNDKKDNLLRASSRVSYERDMAVVEDSIKRMRDEVRKNPKNEAAKQILRNSYQNKIELLSSVSERSDLMARLD